MTKYGPHTGLSEGERKRATRLTRQLVAARVQSERQFQTAVVQYARLNGFKAYHTHDSRRSAPGFPDLVLVRERVIYAELKAEKGKLSQAQREWIEALSGAGATVHVWRPSDWNEISLALGRQARRAA